MTKDIVSTQDVDANTIETVVINGDLSKLSPGQRLQYYQAVCKSIGLNPLTKPFDYITLSGKLTLYARKDAAEQLRKNNRVSIDKLDKETINGVYVVTAYASTPDGRKDISTGAVNIEKLAGDALANALMKAETKAKRRATLSICGLGWLDETEIETIADARPANVNDQGEIVETKRVINGVPDDAEPTEEAWAAWDNLVANAETAGVDAPAIPVGIKTGQLRQLYKELHDKLK